MLLEVRGAEVVELVGVAMGPLRQLVVVGLSMQLVVVVSVMLYQPDLRQRLLIL